MSDHGGHIPSNREREIGREAIRRIREQVPGIVTQPREPEPEAQRIAHDPELCAYCRGLDCWTCTNLERDLRHCDHPAPQRHGAPTQERQERQERPDEPTASAEPEAPPMPEEEPHEAEEAHDDDAG